MRTIVATLLLATALTCCQASSAKPTVFSEENLGQAQEKAKAEKKLLIVDFTASWCGPCHKMDDTTWSDPRVQKWINENAIAVQIDVDKNKAKSLFFKISAMPTIVVMVPPDYGQEFDRQVGYQDSLKLLTWLEGIKKGKSALSSIKDQLAKVEGKGGKDEVQGRMFIAHQLTSEAKYQEATDQYVWLWNNIPKQTPDLIPLRFTLIVAEISHLSKLYPPGRARFAQLRDEALKGDNRLDWMALNHVLDDESATLKWFDQVKEERKKFYSEDPGKTAARERFILQDLLIRKRRWADVAVYLYTEPEKKLNETFERTKQFAASHKELDPLPREAATLYTCFLAANLDDKADKLAREAIRLDNTEKMRRELVMTPFNAGFLKPNSLKWLEDMPATTSDNFSLECARLFLAVGEYQKGLTALDRAVKAGQRTSVVYCDRGVAHFKLHQDQLAMKDFDQSEKVDPKNAWPWVNRSAVFFREKKFKQAYETADKAIELNPQIMEAYCNRGEAALGLDKLDQAVTDLSRAVDSRLKSLKGEAFYYRSQAFLKQGKKELADQDKKMADLLKFKPED